METVQIPISKLLDFAPLKPAVKRQVTQVYAWLSFGFVLAICGYVLPIPRIVAAPVAMLSYIALFGSFSKPYKQAAFISFAVAKGASIHFLEFIPQELVLQALLYTSLVFFAFSASVLSSPTRYMSYIMSLISTGSMILIANSFASWIFGIRLNLYFELVIGILVFATYILYDTQVMIYKAEQGQIDVLRAAADLYVDAVALFVRIALLLNEKQQKKKRNKSS
eukprot:NODE_241_length_13209_cov_0.424256.p5 type:complete len:223 gc:universal NODE_241_length_13209_cov_0.424256:4300-3632(-)